MSDLAIRLPVDPPITVPRITYEILRGNTFGILESDGSAQEKIARLLALIPVWMSVTDEARATITRLREENEKLRGEK